MVEFRSRRLRSFGALVLTIGLAAGATIGSGAQTVTSPTLDVRLTLLADGTAPFEVGAPTPDQPGGAGLDAAPDNGVVRTYDDVMLRLQWSVNDADATNVRVRSTLPAGMSWVSLPTSCRTTGVVPPSSFLGGTLDCNVGDRHQGENGTVDAVARVGGLGNALPIELTASATADSGAPATSVPVALLTSAAPKLNLVAQRDVAGNPEQVPGSMDAVSDPGGAPGRVFLYPVTVEVGGSGKGSEPPAAGDLRFHIDYALLPPSARLADPAAFPLQFPYAGIETCGPTNWIMVGSPYGRIGITPDATEVKSVVDSGSWTCANDAAAKRATIVISGADLTPASTPSKDDFSQSLRPGRAVLVSGTVGIWVSDADLIAISGRPGQATLPPITVGWDVEPSGVSGAPNTGEDATDDTAIATYRYEVEGEWDSYYTNTPAAVHADTGAGLFDLLLPDGLPSTVPEYKKYVPTQTQDSNIGDGRVTPGQPFGFSTNRSNHSGAARNVASCVQLGPGQSITPIVAFPSYDFDAVGNADAYFSGGAPVRTTVTDPAFGIGAYTATNSSILVARVTPWFAILGPSDLAQPVSTTNVAVEFSTDPADYTLNCSDTLNWTTTVPANPATVTRVRFRTLQALRPQESVQFYVSLKALAGMPGDKLWATASQLTWPAGDPFPVLATDWQGTAGYDPAQWCNLPSAFPHSTDNDCLTLAGSELGLTKHVIGTTADLRGGDLVTYEIHASVAGDAGAVADHVVVTDTLPTGLSYVPTATPAPTTASPTALSWDFGTLPVGTDITIRYQTAVAHGLPTYATLVNAAHISGDITAGSVTTPLPSLDATASVLTGGSYAEFEILKLTTTQAIDPGGTVHYDLVAANAGTTALGDTSLIDVLPFVGDGRTPPTAFHGTMTLAAVTPPPGATVRYTSVAPGSVVIDPEHPSNLVGGSTLWCEQFDTDPVVPEIGTPGCPATLADTTAVRVDRAGPLDAGATLTIGLDMATTGNRAADRYTNRFGGRIGGIDLPVRSNEVTAVVRGVDLSLTKVVVDAGPFVLDDQVTFAVTVANSGPDTATGVEVRDTLPRGLGFVSADGGGAGMPASPTVTWTVASIPAGGTVVLHVTAQIIDVDPTALVNLAEVTRQDQADADSEPAENPLDPSSGPDQDDEASAAITATTPTTTTTSTTTTTVPASTTTVPANTTTTTAGSSTTTSPASTTTPAATTTVDPSTTMPASTTTAPTASTTTAAPTTTVPPMSSTSTLPPQAPSTTAAPSAAPTIAQAPIIDLRSAPTTPATTTPATTTPSTTAPSTTAPSTTSLAAPETPVSTERVTSPTAEIPTHAIATGQIPTARPAEGTEVLSSNNPAPEQIPLAFTGTPARAVAALGLLLLGVGLLLSSRRRQPQATLRQTLRR